MCCGVGRRCGSDSELLWLWCRPAAVAQIRPLAWEPAVGVALKRQKKKKKSKESFGVGYKMWPGSERALALG